MIEFILDVYDYFIIFVFYLTVIIVVCFVIGKSYLWMIDKFKVDDNEE